MSPRIAVASCFGAVVVASWMVGASAAPAQPASSAQPAATARPPALLEPYAGHSIVLSAHGEQVMGPAATEGVQAMMEAVQPPLPEGCVPGDTRISAHSVSHVVQCQAQAFSFTLTLRQHAPVAAAVAVTGRYALSRPETASGLCEGDCSSLRERLLSALIARVRAHEAAVVLQRVQQRQGQKTDGWNDALEAARVALATGSPDQARLALRGATRRRMVGKIAAPDAFDLALLAHAAGDEKLKRRAVERLEAVLAAALATPKTATPKTATPKTATPKTATPKTATPKTATPKTATPKTTTATSSTAADAGLRVALPLLGDGVQAALPAVQACASDPRSCDVLPAVRALAATERFADAAAALDAGPLAAGAPPPGTELLKLRFGLASANKDAATEIAIARRMIAADPDSPVGVDLLSSGLLRAGRHREAIEMLHDLSKKHPERDIVLGRIAGMVAFLRGAAGDDPALQGDLDAVQARMKAAAAEPTDIVARFLDATRKYYAGDLLAALPELQALRSSDNRDPRIPLYLAMTHFWLGDHGKARALIDEAVLAGPSDPDVFYCRSQIARHRDLPLAIADLERYVKMTNRPWALNPAKKDARVKAELDYMHRGLLPPDWDRPGPKRVPFDPDNQKGTPVSEAVRRGATSPAASATATDAASAATSASGSTDSDAASDVKKGADGRSAAPEQDSGGGTALPIAILLALLAAVGVRLWSRRQG